jgi:hypothetical protein
MDGCTHECTYPTVRQPENHRLQPRQVERPLGSVYPCLWESNPPSSFEIRRGDENKQKSDAMTPDGYMCDAVKIQNFDNLNFEIDLKFRKFIAKV